MGEDRDFPALVRQIRAGDDVAAEQLVRRFEPIIRREVRLRLEDDRLNRAFDSMDVSQSVLASFFVRVAIGEYDLDRPDQLVRLLVVMTRNKLASRARHERRQRRDVRRVALLSTTDLSELVDPRPSASEMISRRELLDRMREALRVEEREIADLRGEGLSWDDVARQFGGTAQARRVQLARGVERAMKQLGLDD
jgi:RNA polymerase sigma-70 factor (ECF subfamily)